jgi:transcriptional regulator with XRE-family HTH domain
MTFSNALRHTMSEFRLTGTELSKKSGVSKNTISAFRQGTQSLTVENLEKLLGAMPDEARRYFFSELANARQSSDMENLAQAV